MYGMPYAAACKYTVSNMQGQCTRRWVAALCDGALVCNSALSGHRGRPTIAVERQRESGRGIMRTAAYTLPHSLEVSFSGLDE